MFDSNNFNLMGLGNNFLFSKPGLFSLQAPQFQSHLSINDPLKPSLTSTLNPYMTTNQTAQPKNPIPLDPSKLNSIGGMIGLGADMLSGIFGGNKDGYLGRYGNILLMGDLAFDTASNMVMAVNPLAGGIMKAGGLVSDVLTNYAGMGTDSMTKTDALLGSKLLSLTPAGMINGFFGKKTLDMSVNKDTIEQVGSSYGGSVDRIMQAKDKANKKYGLFSSSSRRKANRYITEAKRLQNLMTNIASEASDLQSMAGNDLNYINYNFNMSGGYDLRYMRAAKQGMKILDKISLIKLKRSINNFINLETKKVDWEPIIEYKLGGTIEKSWEPTITQNNIEEFENEGIIENIWEPIISYQKGGTLKDSLDVPETEETSLKNVIPEGALHKNKHHMEHAEGLTKKGIPVIDEDGDQLAEIELNEIIFTLEVTKKLEELYKKYYSEEHSLKEKDEFAIDAGKLLVKEILFNTEDRTGLISKCEKGGILNEVS